LQHGFCSARTLRGIKSSRHILTGLRLRTFARLGPVLRTFVLVFGIALAQTVWAALKQGTRSIGRSAKLSHTARFA
jgi:hypothetical protein